MGFSFNDLQRVVRTPRLRTLLLRAQRPRTNGNALRRAGVARCYWSLWRAATGSASRPTLPPLPNGLAKDGVHLRRICLGQVREIDLMVQAVRFQI